MSVLRNILSFSALVSAQTDAIKVIFVASGQTEKESDIYMPDERNPHKGEFLTASGIHQAFKAGEKVDLTDYEPGQMLFVSSGELSAYYTLRAASVGGFKRIVEEQHNVHVLDGNCKLHFDTLSENEELIDHYVQQADRKKFKKFAEEIHCEPLPVQNILDRITGNSGVFAGKEVIVLSGSPTWFKDEFVSLLQSADNFEVTKEGGNYTLPAAFGGGNYARQFSYKNNKVANGAVVSMDINFEEPQAVEVDQVAGQNAPENSKIFRVTNMKLEEGNVDHEELYNKVCLLSLWKRKFVKSPCEHDINFVPNPVKPSQIVSFVKAAAFKVSDRDNFAYQGQEEDTHSEYLSAMMDRVTYELNKAAGKGTRPHLEEYEEDGKIYWYTKRDIPGHQRDRVRKLTGNLYQNLSEDYVFVRVPKSNMNRKHYMASYQKKVDGTFRAHKHEKTTFLDLDRDKAVAHFKTQREHNWIGRAFTWSEKSYGYWVMFEAQDFHFEN